MKKQVLCNYPDENWQLDVCYNITLALVTQKPCKDGRKCVCFSELPQSERTKSRLSVLYIVAFVWISSFNTPNKQSLNGVASRKLISMNVHACVLKLGYWHWYSKLYTQQNNTLVSLKDCYEETSPLRGRNLYSLNFVFIRSVIWELWPEIPAFCVPSTDQSFINFWSFGSDSMEI